MVQNKIVIRYADGRLLKGITNDFSPNKEVFHVSPTAAAPGAKPQEIRIAELKAVFSSIPPIRSQTMKDVMSLQRRRKKSNCCDDNQRFLRNAVILSAGHSILPATMCAKAHMCAW